MTRIKADHGDRGDGDYCDEDGDYEDGYYEGNFEIFTDFMFDARKVLSNCVEL